MKTHAKTPRRKGVKNFADFAPLREALRLAKRGYGMTSPNPMVGAVLVKGGKIIGRGWHRRAGLPHAEIEALRDAQKHGHNPKARRFTSRWNRVARTAARRLARMPSLPPASNASSSAPPIRIHNMRARVLKFCGARELRWFGGPRSRGRFCLARRDGHGICRRMRAAKRGVQPLDCPPHAVRHREGRDDTGRKNRHRQRRIEMDHRRKSPRARHEIAPGQRRDSRRHEHHSRG